MNSSTSDSAAIRSRGHFVDGGAGRIFLTEHGPRDADSVATALLILPAFAEEMNKSRRMYTLLAAELAARGTVTVVLDYQGCGDSEGDFEDARWSTWQRDVRCAVDWIRDGFGERPLALLGHRLGAALALGAAAEPMSRIDRMLWWQPVLQGQQFLTQFLRLRIAGGLTGAGADSRETTQSLRQAFAEGRSLEIAGYTLAADLAHAIDQLDALDDLTARCPPIHWLELQQGQAASLPPARQKLLDRIRALDQTVSLQLLTGEPFWSLQEITDVPALIAATVEAVYE